VASVADLFDKLNAVKRSADETANAREHYAAFLAFMRDEAGWSPEEVADYKAKIGILMGKDDEAAMALFPPGVFENAEQARAGARTFWKSWCDNMRPAKI
jgi:hypothetical protein